MARYHHSRVVFPEPNNRQLSDEALSPSLLAEA
jgi:hypothetical protein